MKIAKVKEVKTPTRGTAKSAGIDFYIPEGFDQVLMPGHDILIPSGIHVDIPVGYMLYATNKSGVVTSKMAQTECRGKAKDNAFEGVVILGAATVDEDYQGEVHIHLINLGPFSVHLTGGMKIAQFVLLPVSYEGIEVASSLEELYSKTTERGAGGFGSTGV